MPAETAPPDPSARAADYARMARALEWLAVHHERQPSLAEAAHAAGLSEHHFQRTFSRWAGISPKKYVQYLTLERAKRALEEAHSVLDAAWDAGLSGPGRLHDLFVSLEAMTPGEYKRRGEGLEVRHGVHDSPFGECLIMASPRGVCGLAFTTGRERGPVLTALARGLERARLVHDPASTAAWARRIFDPGKGAERDAIPVAVGGTPFQVRVWEALLRIPPGALASYAHVAAAAGASPSAARAAGAAVGANPVAWLIPCHRVIRASGVLGGYRWGRARKLAMLSLEAARAAQREDRTAA